MDTRQLKYFIDVANYLNFTKAAQQNHIAQTAMSQNIISLEKQLGFKLFQRTNRSVSLTHMGKAFYPEAEAIVRLVEQAEARMAMTISGSRGSIHIGFQGEHESRFLPYLLRSFRKTYPDVSLELTQAISAQLEDKLETGAVDLIFNIEYTDTSPNTEEWLIEAQQLCLVVTPEHPLASHKTVSRSMLSTEKLVFLNPTCGENIFNYMIHESLGSGFSPDIVGYASSIYSLLLMVECGLGITILPISCNQNKPNLVFVPLDGDSPLNIVARWRSVHENPSLDLFLTLLRTAFPRKA